MKNADIRNAAAKAGVKLWQVADKMGITDSTFSRKLRKELPDADRERVLGVIAALAKEAV